MHKSPLVRRPVMVPAVLALLAACGAEPRGAPAPLPLDDPGRSALHVGLDEQGPAAAIGRVVSARLSEGGRHVVVLDFVAPFVKVFDQTGRFRKAFVQQGGGPGEARRPNALAVSGDSLILVADRSTGISVFDMEGRLRTQATVRGLRVLAATAPCPGEWLLYGPRARSRGGEMEVFWLHRARVVGPDSMEVQSFVKGPLPPQLSIGIAYGLVADRGGAVVRHTLGDRPRLLRLDCAGGEPRVLQEGEAVEQAAPRRVSARVAQTSVTVGSRALGGVAAPGSAVVFGEKVYVGDGRGRVDMTLLDADGERVLSIAGNFTLLDSRPGLGVLVGTEDPVPQVFLIPEKDFLRMFPSR